ncbi:MAG: hypothetical protein A2231_07570 [Candidatus Firestonebacteria bacterium RIFOXYA2_FULL_40_8]|nr:MAG: hypothetical protein A2231_07570 [Candidatus Firestonebacteria bacterium RIFOXYA2_FULL_40_8]
MRCYSVKRLLNRYVDKEIDETTKKFMEEHLKVCALCKKELEALLLMKHVISKKEKLEIDKNFISLLEKRLMEEKPDNETHYLTEMNYLAQRTAPVLLTLAVLVMIIIFAFYNDSQVMKDYMDNVFISKDIPVL